MQAIVSKISFASTTVASRNYPLELQKAIEAKDPETALSILKETDLANKPLPNGEMPLTYAIRRGGSPFAEKLILEQPFNLDLKDHQGLTPLDHAVIAKDEKIVTLILSKKIGATLNSDGKKALSKHQMKKIETLADGSRKLLIETSSSPLHKAAAEGDLTKLASYSSKEFNAYDSFGLTPLHYAALFGKTEAVEWLMNQGAASDLLTKRDNSSLLHLAVLGGNEDLVKRILNKLPFSIDLADAQGRSALHLAMSRENFDISQLLIRNGANPLLKNEKEDLSPLDIALHLAHSRGNERDPLKLSLGDLSIFVSVAASCLAYLCPYAEIRNGIRYAADALVILGILKKGGDSKSTFLCGFGGLKIWNVLISLSPPHSLDFSTRQVAACYEVVGQVLLTYTCCKSALQGISAAWKNRFLESYRPIRNAMILGSNAIFSGRSIVESVDRIAEIEAERIEDERKWKEKFEKLFGKLEEDDFKPIHKDFCKGKTSMDCILDPTLNPIEGKGHAEFILGLGDKDSCKRNFRVLSQQLHPDAQNGKGCFPKEKCVQAFLKVQQSASVLGCVKDKISPGVL